MKKAVILLSGGLDSAVTFYWAKKHKFTLTALIVDYHQRHRKEIESAKKIAKLNTVAYQVVKVQLPWVHSSLTDKHINVPCGRDLASREIPVTYVSGRNIIFLSYAFSLAESIGARAIFIGAHVQDYSGYPDCRPWFLKSFQEAANAGMKAGNIRVVAPLIDKGKKEIIRDGLKLGVPFQYTWSCYQGGKRPCSECDSCRFRIKAFEELGLTDPLIAQMNTD
ncbi:MAG: 7-cyano-7-deazaguanine synthase QueC [Candidatus Omnitrophota bacterium]